MAKRTAQIVLGGVTYTVHAFNLGELQQIAKVFAGPPMDVPFAVLRLALARGEPKVANADEIEPDDPNEVAAAMKVILELAGLRPAAENPPQAPAQPGA